MVELPEPAPVTMADFPLTEKAMFVEGSRSSLVEKKTSPKVDRSTLKCHSITSPLSENPADSLLSYHLESMD